MNTNTTTPAEVGAYYAQHGRAIVLYDPQSATTRPILRLEPGEHEDVLLSLMDAANAYAEAVELLLCAQAYVDDVLADPTQLAQFKKGVVEKHSRDIHAFLAKVDAP